MVGLSNNPSEEGASNMTVTEPTAANEKTPEELANTLRFGEDMLEIIQALYKEYSVDGKNPFDRKGPRPEKYGRVVKELPAKAAKELFDLLDDMHVPYSTYLENLIEDPIEDARFCHKIIEDMHEFLDRAQKVMCAVCVVNEKGEPADDWRDESDEKPHWVD
jgi:hypothetical protein